MTRPAPTIRVTMDANNPGQFFACCGLLELADRLWPGATGWFETGEFCIACSGHLKTLIESLAIAQLTAVDPEDTTSTAIRIGHPFSPPLLINWWLEEQAGTGDGRELKVWAGSMESFGIARAMQQALQSPAFHAADLLDREMVVPDPAALKKNSKKTKKKEPYYFDHRRAANAHSRDVGFSVNKLGLATLAHPAVELLCLIGLQRGLPSRTDQARIFDYWTWSTPIGPELVPAAVTNLVGDPGSRGYRFECGYRTGQRKHKAFRSAVSLCQGSRQ